MCSMYARHSVESEPGTLCHWLGCLTWQLDPLVDVVRRHALDCTKAFALRFALAVTVAITDYR